LDYVTVESGEIGMSGNEEVKVWLITHLRARAESSSTSADVRSPSWCTHGLPGSADKPQTIANNIQAKQRISF
jgi:hypothetical protein